MTKTEQDQIISKALAILRRRCRRGTQLTTPTLFAKYLQVRLAGEHNEKFGVVFIDNRNRVIADIEMFQGTIDGASVHPRVIVAKALELNGAAVMLYHNHPSGVAEPSNADERITTRIRDALALVEIRVMDHLIVSGEGYTSFAERGLI